MFFFDDYTDDNADAEDVVAGCVVWRLVVVLKERWSVLCSSLMTTQTAMPMRRRWWRAVWCGDWRLCSKKDGLCDVVVRVVVVVASIVESGEWCVVC